MEVGVILVNAEGLITSVSRSVEKWTGKSFADVHNQPLATLFREKDQPRISRLTGSVPVPGERIITCRLQREKEGSQLVQLRLSRITNGSTHGSIAAILVRHERGSESVPSSVNNIPLVPVAVALLDSRYRIQSVSSNWEEATGLRINETSGRSLNEIFPQIDDTFEAEFEKRADAGNNFKAGISIDLTGDDQVSTRSFQLTLMHNATRFTKDAPFIAAVRDVTDLDTLEEHCGQQRAILDQVNDAIIAADEDFHILSWNARAEEMYGWSSEEVVGKEISEVVRLSFPGKTRREIRERVLREGKWSGRGIHYDREGRAMVVFTSISILTDSEGKTIGTVAVNRDISHLAETEEALKHSESLFRSVVSHLGEGLVLADETGTVLYLNDRMADISGYETSELIGRNIYQILFDPEELPAVEERIEAGLKGRSERYRTQINRKDASRLWVGINSSPYYDEDREITGILSLVTDISEQRALEESLLERDRLLQTTAEAAAALIQDQDLAVSINNALRILGEGLDVDRVYVFQNHPSPETDELLTSQLFEWVRDGIQPQLDNPILQNFPLAALPRWEQRLSAGDVIDNPLSEVPLVERVVMEAQEIKSILVVPIMLEGEFWGFVGYDDCRRERRWSENEKALMLTVSGSIGSAVQRMETERDIRLARSRAEKANERSTRFLANMSHEFRSPLAVVLGYTDLLKALVDSGDELPQDTLIDSLTAIRRSGKRLQALVHNLLDISSIEDGTLHMISNEVEVNRTVENVVEELRGTIEDKGLELKIELWPEALTVRGDPVRVEEIITNLVENAAKFTREGFVAVRTQMEYVQQTCSAVIEVEDSGVGISEEYLGQIFNPFTQESSGTTRAFEGAGLGLALSQRLAKMMGGSIRARSIKGKGSTFVVRLPCAKQKSYYQRGTGMVPSETGPMPAEEPGIPRALVVGPHRPIFRLWEHLLHENCTFTYASSPQAAQALLKEHDFKVVLFHEQELIDRESAGKVIREMRDHWKSSGLLMVGVGGDETAAWAKDSALLDDAISPLNNIDIFFEKFIQWLHDAKEDTGNT